MNTKEIQRIAKERDSRAFIENPDIWGCWPVCPVKRYRNKPDDPELGVILAVEGMENVVLLTNMFLLTKNVAYDGPQIKYDSLDDLLAAGWEVD